MARDVHWLSDVIGGLALGTAYLLIAIGTTPTLFDRATPRPVDAAIEPLEAGPPA